MSSAKMPKGTPRARQQVNIGRALFFEALHGWIVPLGVGGLGLSAWVAYNIEIIRPESAVTLGGGLALLVALYVGLRRYLDERTARPAALLVAGFSAVWALITFIPFYRAVNLPPPVLATELRAAAPAVPVPLHGQAGPYRVVVEGHFRPTEEHNSRSAHYRMLIGGSAGDQALEGDFTERWGRQRLGRRGSAPVQRLHDIGQHAVESPDGADLTLALESMSPTATDSVTVRVYPATFPNNLFAGLSVLLVAAALIVDALQGFDPGSPIMTCTTLCALFGVYAFRSFAAARPGFGDLLVYGALGSVAGMGLGTVLWRIARPSLRRLTSRTPWLANLTPARG